MPTTRGAGLAVLVPTYNEASNVDPLLDGLLAAVPEAAVLVVDDASPDGTAARVRARAAVDPRVHLRVRTGPRGLGLAYLDGFRWALAHGFRAVGQMDADLSHDPADWPRLLAALDGGADLVLGTRYMPGGGVQGWARRRQALSRAGNAYARAVLGLPHRDLTGGFKVFRADLLRGLPLGAVRARGYAFQVEMTWRAVRAGARVAEVPIVFRERRGGQSKLSGAIVGDAVVGLWALRWAGGG